MSKAQVNTIGVKGFASGITDFTCLREKALIDSCNQIEELQAENARQKEALVRIRNWAQAYPTGVFPKPDLEKARDVLKAVGMTLDAISADAMRHVLNGIKDIVEQALIKEEKQKAYKAVNLYTDLGKLPMKEQRIFLEWARDKIKKLDKELEKKKEKQ